MNKPRKEQECLFIAVIGGSRCSAESTKLAEEVGRELARQGTVLICGGLGGVMEAACRGAHSEGGTVVGILPGNDRKSANPYVTIPIVTGLGYARNSVVVRSAQAVIAIDGSYGTLSEIAYALQDGIPVIGLNTWTLSLNGESMNSIIQAQNAQEAVEIAVAAAQGRK